MYYKLISMMPDIISNPFTKALNELIKHPSNNQERSTSNVSNNVRCKIPTINLNPLVNYPIIILTSSPPWRTVIPGITSEFFCFTAECENFTSRLILAPQTIPACPAVFITFWTLGFRVQMLSISQLASLVKLVSFPAWMPGFSPRK